MSSSPPWHWYLFVTSSLSLVMLKVQSPQVPFSTNTQPLALVPLTYIHRTSSVISAEFILTSTLWTSVVSEGIFIHTYNKMSIFSTLNSVPLRTHFLKAGLIRLKLFESAISPEHCGIEGQNFISLLISLSLLCTRRLEVMWHKMAAISGKTQNVNGQLYSHTPVVVLFW